MGNAYSELIIHVSTCEQLIVTYMREAKQCHTENSQCVQYSKRLKRVRMARPVRIARHGVGQGSNVLPSDRSLTAPTLNPKRFSTGDPSNCQLARNLGCTPCLERS
ncbi:hypothetical protein J6590_009019 [Homalodisca vitripennis]|nr:hypothetical protein J6590_009019 [Homalodisca vitripennis]